MGLAIPIPFLPDHVVCLTLLARLHLPDTDAPSCVDLAKEMLREVLAMFPDRPIVLIGDGAYSAQGLLADLDARAVRGTDARGCGDRRSHAAGADTWQAWSKAQEGTAAAQPA
jgi:hypothetical protein